MTENAKFEQFSEAATLYAEYAAVVDQVRQVFLNEAECFLDALLARTESLVAIPVREDRDRTVRRWWLSEDQDSRHEDHLYVWFYTADTAIVRPGVLDVSPYGKARFKAFRLQIVAVKDALALPPSCNIKKGHDGSPFTLSIAYGNDDPVGEAAGPVADLLSRLFELERTLPPENPPDVQIAK